MIRSLAAIALLLSTPAVAEIADATYVNPTSIYGHNVVPGGEYTTIVFRTSDGRGFAAELSGAVFEDTAPRLVDVDGDGSVEVISVVSYFNAGAAIRIWDEVPGDESTGGTTLEVMAEGEPIGRSYRWLAIVGATDIDGDGQVEIAYVDRPHLAKTLRIVRRDGDKLVEVAALPGFTNHRIGEPDIAGGIRDCGSGPEMIVASANWGELYTVTYDGDFAIKTIGSDTSRSAFAAAMDC